MSLSINKLIVNSTKWREEISFTIHLSISSSERDAEASENYPSSFIFLFPSSGWNNFQRIFDNQITYLAHTVKQHRKFSFFALMRFFTTHKVSLPRNFSRASICEFFTRQKFIQKTFLVCVFFPPRKSIKNF